MAVTSYAVEELAPAAQGSHVTSAAGRIVHVAGQVGADQTGAIVAGGLAEQMAQALRNVELALQAAGATLDDVVKMTIYVPGWEPAKAEQLGIGAMIAYPDRPVLDVAYTLLGVQSLFTPEHLVELEVVAVVDQARDEHQNAA